ncbi:MAG: hypothetical protein AB1632_02040 [Nitrospirota bacterium]
MTKDSILKFSLEKGFGEFFWNLCPICGGVSIRTTSWEDGTIEREECLICNRMLEVMELEEFLKVREQKNSK